jgi:hypothetical protein
LDLYTGPVGSANLTEQIHDFNVHVDSNDVFWMVRVSDDAVRVDVEQGLARLSVRGLALYDDHDLANSLTLGLGLPGDPNYRYPQIPPVSPVRATVSFDVRWSDVVAREEIFNTTQQFRGSFLQTGATIRWTAEEEGFRFDSEPSDPSRNLISVLGREWNGVFF